MGVRTINHCSESSNSTFYNLPFLYKVEDSISQKPINPIAFQSQEDVVILPIIIQLLIFFSFLQDNFQVSNAFSNAHPIIISGQYMSWVWLFVQLIIYIHKAACSFVRKKLHVLLSAKVNKTSTSHNLPHWCERSEQLG
jgi:hypothetical protein